MSDIQVLQAPCMQIRIFLEFYCAFLVSPYRHLTLSGFNGFDTQHSIYIYCPAGLSEVASSFSHARSHYRIVSCHTADLCGFPDRRSVTRSQRAAIHH